MTSGCVIGRISEKMRKKGTNKKRRTPVYQKVILVFLVILVTVLGVIWIVINHYCMDFIKEQRIEYNTQMLEEVEYEFKELYVQMNQLLTSLAGESPENTDGDTIFQRIKSELEFEENIQNMVYLNGFYQFYEGVLYYQSEEEYYYIGQGSIREGYSFQEDENFSQVSEYITDCRVIGPMTEPYKADHVQKENIIGFQKRNAGVAEEGSLAPFVMVAVKFSTIEDMLGRLLSGNEGYFLMDQEGELLDSGNLEALSWTEENIEEMEKTILANPAQAQTLSRDGILLTSIRLENYDWILTVADLEETLFQDINQLSLLVELLIAACGAIGIGAAFWYSKRVLFPVELLKKLVDEMTHEENGYLVENTGDEVMEIRNLLSGMKKKVEDLSRKQYISEVREREAQIRMLQSQINPHFLHNTLDNIYCIAQIEEIDPIVTLTRNLSLMMRYSVNNKNMYVPLEEEIAHVQAYVDIINVRYEDCITLTVDVEEELRKAQVVKLLLQPLVENACVHGILKKEPQTGHIWIRAFRKEENLEIRVEDDGVGITEEIRERMNEVFRKEVLSVRTPKNKGFGIALVNVNDRIRLLDGNSYGIQMECRKEGGTCVTVIQKCRIYRSERQSV